MALSENVRRVVTTIDRGDKAVVLMDGPTPHQKVRPQSQTVSRLIWVTGETPADLSGTRDRAAVDIGIMPPRFNWNTVVAKHLFPTAAGLPKETAAKLDNGDKLGTYLLKCKYGESLGKSGSCCVSRHKAEMKTLLPWKRSCGGLVEPRVRTLAANACASSSS